MSPHRQMLDTGTSVEVADEREYQRRRNSATFELAKFLIPILLAWGLSIYTAREEASSAVKTEVAVIKATEQTHFEEIQRTLRRIDEWMARQEAKGR